MSENSHTTLWPLLIYTRHAQQNASCQIQELYMNFRLQALMKALNVVCESSHTFWAADGRLRKFYRETPQRNDSLNETHP